MITHNTGSCSFSSCYSWWCNRRYDTRNIR
jgi:hypothetical protein